ncbi:T9SS type A sorting domain-containing protein [Flavobacterium sp. 25HG05S-40]|uniref:T9SS type A sorting domain-containing protein n=1 Tax=Flavobacterium sp. 25HG05S-40 TaxID=3458682 RepID=UPI004044BB20
MKKTTLLFVFLLIAIPKSNGQINPVQNVTFSQTYQTPHNFFELNWEEPDQPHGVLLGYNIYRDNELYRFQTERNLYNTYSQVFGFVSNCGIDFLEYNMPNGFLVHVTAVYEGQVESTYTETATVFPPALSNDEFNSQEVLLYPNPTKGILNIENITLEKSIVYDIYGKELLAFSSTSKIDVSSLTKGIYLIKLFSEGKTLAKKIVIE